MWFLGIESFLVLWKSVSALNNWFISPSPLKWFFVRWVCSVTRTDRQTSPHTHTHSHMKKYFPICCCIWLFDSNRHCEKDTENICEVPTRKWTLLIIRGQLSQDTCGELIWSYPYLSTKAYFYHDVPFWTHNCFIFVVVFSTFAVNFLITLRFLLSASETLGCLDCLGILISTIFYSSSFKVFVFKLWVKFALIKG